MGQTQQRSATGGRELLRTKLAPPRLQAELVPRALLLARLAEGVERKLTLLSAPAGYGKTTLVSQWLHSLDVSGVHSLHNPQVIWLSLDSNDNDPVRFWRYLIGVCQQLAPEVGVAALKLLHKASRPSWENVLTKLLNDLAERTNERDHAVLVLEDYHLITAAQVHETLALLLEHLPATFHLMMTTRHDPPLPLAQMRARNELSELRAADLRFSRVETQSFFQQSLPLPLAPAALSYLAERTEGWVAGLRLAALALQKRLEPEAMSHFLGTFRGSHEHIFTYLVAEVLSAQPAQIRQFLLQTCTLSRLCGPLCDAVTGRDESELLLEQLEQANLFLIPLADEQVQESGIEAAATWYRYHALFAEAMQQAARRQLGEEALHTLAQKASLWYEQHGMFTEAVETALMAQEFRRCADLIERTIDPLNPSNEYHTLRRWIGFLPDAILQTHPALAFLYAVAILFTSERRAAETFALLQMPLQIAEEHWLATQNEKRLGAVLAFRALLNWFQGVLDYSFAYAKQALELLPAGERQWRGIALIFVGVEQLQTGQVMAAEKTLTTARAYCESTGNEFGALDAALLLGEVYLRQGELQQSAQLYQYVFDTAEKTQMEREQVTIRIGNALLGLGTVGYAWNMLEKAEQQGKQALMIGTQVGYVDLQSRASLLLARIEHARGETEAAQQRLHALIAQPTQPRWLTLVRRVRAEQAWFAIAAGDIAMVEQWAATVAEQYDDIDKLQQEQEALLLARLRVEQGNLDAALEMLEAQQNDARTQGRTETLIEILIIKALAYCAANQVAQAREALSEALYLGQPGGYVRLFVDEGKRLARLWTTLLPGIRDEPMLSYVRSLLAAFDEECGEAEPSLVVVQPRARVAAAELVEPLSERESDVLRLVATGLGTDEVARELVISVGTVRTHLKHIYGKLDAHSRVQAVERARALNLL